MPSSRARGAVVVQAALADSFLTHRRVPFTGPCHARDDTPLDLEHLASYLRVGESRSAPPCPRGMCRPDRKARAEKLIEILCTDSLQSFHCHLLGFLGQLSRQLARTRAIRVPARALHRSRCTSIIAASTSGLKRPAPSAGRSRDLRGGYMACDRHLLVSRYPAIRSTPCGPAAPREFRQGVRGVMTLWERS